MKKFLLFLTVFVASLGLQAATNPSASELQQIAIDFDWTNGNEQSSGTQWYKVDLSQVPSDENLMLYLDNLTSDAAEVTVRIALITGNTAQIQDDATTTKTIDPNRHYAKEISHNLFGKMQTVYVELTTNKHIHFYAEAVEPGEKDAACLNGVEFVRTGTTHQAGKQWYKVDLSDVISDQSKSIKVTVKNNGSATTVKAGISFDCPSSGVTNKSMAFKAGETKSKTMERSYIDMVGTDEMVYILLESDQPLYITAEVVDAPVPSETYTVENAINFELDKLYQHEANVQKWYKVTLADINLKRQMPEVTIENKGNATAKIDGVLIYAKANDNLTDVPASATHTISVEAGSALVREVQRNMVEAAAEKYDYAYIRVTNNNPFEFIARMKDYSAGTQCLKAVDFDWENGNVQNGETTVWYAVDMTPAKSASANVKQDIVLTIDNLGRAATNVKAQIAASCPCDVTQDMSRTIAAGETAQKTINYSMWSAIASDTVWVGFTTSQNVHIYADLIDAAPFDTIYDCEEAIEFDWDNGHLQDPDTMVWYKVPIYKILTEANSHNQVPEITVTNRGNASATVTAEMSFECPVTSEMQSRTITIAANDKYVKSPTLDLINSIDTAYEYIYFRVLSSQEISIQANFKYEEEGKYCSTAEEFNWTLGVDYVAADPYWYAVDVAEARANEQDIVVSMKNPNNTAVTVLGEMTIECPIVNGTVSRTYTVAANETVEKRITYATLYGLGADIIYLRITADKNLHFDARMEDDPTQPTNICQDADIEIIDFDWENGHVQEAGTTVWYRVKLDTLRSEMVPQVTVENLGEGTTEVRGEVAFQCDVKLESMMGKTIILEGKGDEWTRAAEKSEMAQIDSTAEYAYIRVTTSDSIRFNGGLVDPNVGDECYHAINFDWENGNIHTAGDTLWYKVDLTYVTEQNNQGVTVGIKNLDGFTGVVHADLYFTCEDTIPFESVEFELQGDYAREIELQRELLTSIDATEILICLYADQKDSLYARLHTPEDPELVEGCDEAIEAQLNLIIDHAAGGQWYYVDIAYMKDVDDNGEPYTQGDALLEVWNGAEANNITASFAWDCPATEKMLDKTISLDNEEEYNHTILRSVIDNVNKDILYVYVSTESDMKFRLSMTDLRGSACLNPIEYDWENGNTHPGESSLWYKINLDTLDTEYAKDKDLRITVVNLADVETEAEAVVMQGCGVNDTLGTAQRTLQPLDSLSKEISHVVIDSILQGEPIYVYLTSSENVYLHAELIGQLEKYEVDTTIVDTVCDGALYKYAIAGGDSISRLISSEEYSEFPVKWTDTIPFIYDNVLDADSIIHYEIHLMSMPKAPGLDELPLTLYCGRAMDFSDVNDSILNYFYVNAADTVAGVLPETLKWEYYDPEEEKIKEVGEDKLGFDERQVILIYSIETTCGDIIGSDQFGTTVELDTTYIHRDTIEMTLCEGESTLIGDEDVIVYADTTVTYSYIVENWDYELQQDVDSIITYVISVWKAPELITQFEEEDKPVAQLGKAVDVENATEAILSDIADQVEADPLVVATADTVYWQILSNGEYADLYDDHIDSVESVTLRYGIYSEVCDTMYYSEDIVITTLPKDSFIYEQYDTVCYNDMYITHDNPNGIQITDSMVIRERFSYPASDEQDVDSVYIYHVYVYLDYTEETLTPIDAQLGTILSTEDAEAELIQKLDAQNQADPLKVKYTEIGWDVKEGGVYQMGDNIATEETIILEYTVYTECEVSILKGEVAVNLLPADSVVTDPIIDTVCVNDTYDSRLETGKVITADTKWTERIALADREDEGQWKDSVYVYEVYVYTVPQAQAVSTLPTASCGKPVVVDEATEALYAAFEPTDASAPVDSIAWEIDLGNGWADLTDEALDTRIPSVQMRYKAYTICGDEVISEAITVVPADDCVEEIEEVTDTICAGDEYTSRLQTLTINEYTEFADTVMVVGEDGNKFDSIYNYIVYVFNPLQLPEVDAIDPLPQAVCGEELRLADAVEAIKVILAEDELNEPVDTITWEVKMNGEYEAVADQTMPASMQTVDLRYTVVGQCTSASAELTIDVEKPNPLNMPEKYPEQEAVEKYEGWLLMINYLKLSEHAATLGWEVTEDKVTWYKVNGEPDVIAVEPGDLPDDSVGIGYYYTEAEILNPGDQYYAVIEAPVSEEDECGGSMFTNLLTIQGGATPLSLAPNIVKPGEEMIIHGLRSDVEYIVAVYDLTGICVERHNVSDTNAYTLEAQSTAGYYMVQVSSEAENVRPETLKYVVK